MAKFLKFSIVNGQTLTSGIGSRDVLLNVDDIENVSDGAGAGSVVITLKSGLAQYQSTTAAGTASSVAGRILTLSTGLNQDSAPVGGGTAIAAVTVPSVIANMPSQSVNRAMTANPGGVAAKVSLALDGAGVRGTDSQMYWVQAAYSTDNTL
tara:strand:+ start:5591 stop:6046 length:456 start_codon:yes stop_codon:yes gene_type:complete